MKGLLLDFGGVLTTNVFRKGSSVEPATARL